MDDDTFTLTAYDTTKSYKEGELPCAAAIAQEGILEIMEIDLGSILKLGLTRIKNKEFIPVEDNVIKVDFGAKQ